MFRLALPLPLVVLLCAVFLLTGAAFVRRGWRHDRACGRRRCPACWYDMSSLPGLTCPECGNTVSVSAALLKTRRSRWKLAVGAILVLSSAAPFLFLSRDRFWSWVPSPVLIRLIDPVSNSGVLREELYHRLTTGELSEPQWTALARRHLRGGCADVGERITIRARWPAGAPVMLTLTDDAPFRGHFVGRRLRIDTGRNRAVTYSILPRGSPAVAALAPTQGAPRSVSVGIFRPGSYELQCECVLEEAVVRSLSDPTIRGWRPLLRCPITLEFEVVPRAELSEREGARPIADEE